MPALTCTRCKLRPRPSKKANFCAQCRAELKAATSVGAKKAKRQWTAHEGHIAAQVARKQRIARNAEAPKSPVVGGLSVWEQRPNEDITAWRQRLDKHARSFLTDQTAAALIPESGSRVEA